MNIRRNQEKKSCFADIRGLYVWSSGPNDTINMTYVLEYVLKQLHLVPSTAIRKAFLLLLCI